MVMELPAAFLQSRLLMFGTGLIYIILLHHTCTDGHRYPRAHSSVTPAVMFCHLAIFTINSRFEDGSLESRAQHCFC